MKQTLNTFPITPLNGNPAAVKARLAADVPFTASTGEVHLPGDAQHNYVEYALSLNGNGRTFPTANDIDSTTDSTDPNATYTLYLLDVRDKEIGTLFERWMFDASLGISILYTDLEGRNTHKVSLTDDQVYTKMQIDNLLLGRTLINPGLVPVGTGTGMLVAGTPTTILSSAVQANSSILALPISDEATGPLRISNRVVGVSFDVTSENGADAGGFQWFLW